MMEKTKKEIAVIGGGVIGIMTALQLRIQGHHVVLIDPSISKKNTATKELNGSQASLGILMGNLFRRSKGRSWNLRKRSMELWPNWVQALNTSSNQIKIDTPIIQLASSLKEAEKMQTLCKEKAMFDLEFFDKPPEIFNNQFWPVNKYGGLISYRDGRINPKKLLLTLTAKLKELKVEINNNKVASINHPNQTDDWKWKITLDNFNCIMKDTLVICSALESEKLLQELGHNYQLKPVLGQALHLKIKEDINIFEKWPAVLISEGVNLIPYKTNELIMGATIEEGVKPNEKFLKIMKEMNGNKPDWLKKASIEHQWSGIRAKPSNEPAPILKKVERGLIINTGHYRNGILLAPACAEWVANQI